VGLICGGFDEEEGTDFFLANAGVKRRLGLFSFVFVDDCEREAVPLRRVRHGCYTRY
jgi:hypothetical protein